ncbi:MAG: CYTH and CHAD domain-containing protein [Rhodocyclaceae bacterium]|nr:CYTH and CHAD domain-containing protein [Rhodocyclaceae bacterium]
MEIEFKLSCTPRTAATLGRKLTRLTGMPPQKLRLQNTYYDTPNQDLRAHGIALRIRKQGNTTLQTVKCAGIVSGGLSSRPEWETPYGDRFDFSAVTDARVRDQLEILARLPGYRATLDTHFSRHVWHWRPDADTHVEIVLDRGRILAGGREEGICEIELELASGAPERLLDLVAHLGTLAPLFPCPLSKATRGNLLLAGPGKSPAPDMVQAANCHDAFVALAQDCLDHISINLPANCSRFSAEHLHQARAGMRRLRALLQLFRPLLRRGWPCSEIERGAQRHMAALAPARNLHVFLTDLVAPAATSVDPRSGQRLQRHLVDMSQTAFATAEAHLQTREFSDWLLHSSLALHARPMSDKAAARSWTTQARKLIQCQLEAYDQKLHHVRHTPAALHKVRKAGKHLRYQLAVSTPADTPHPHAAGKRLSRLQDTLGALNDLYSAADIANRLPASYAPIIAAIGSHHIERHEALRKQAFAQLKHLRRDIRALRSEYRKARQ